jgi:hypothetical protein
MAFSREQLREHATSLAVQGFYIGASSWKYPGFRLPSGLTKGGFK